MAIQGIIVLLGWLTLVKGTTVTTSATTTPTSTGKPDIYSLHIRSDVAYRFATTTVVSKLANRAQQAQEAVFNVQLPKSAFISNFTMTIDGVEYPGEVKEKEAAKKKYEQARSQGRTAGHVAAKPRNTNAFKVSVNVAASSKITFELKYEELLQRKLGVYEIVTHINPGQVVRDFKVDVYIHESREITLLKVPPLQSATTNEISLTQDNPLAVITREAANKAHIQYHPTAEQQQADNDKGLQGRFLVQYDVKRVRGGGEIQVVNGYFVHYFAPSGIPASNKNVLFVLDVSGSMAGRKLRQVKDAMKVILNDLRRDDYFNIILFSSYLTYWNDKEMVSATAEHVQSAQDFISRMSDQGSTNIQDALSKGLEFLERHEEKTGSDLTSMIIFLTDGQPTSGETSTGRIIDNIKRANKDRYTLFSLGFGSGVDFSFLQKLSLQNKGVARKIYEDSDADVQLKGFYNEVATPLLSDVKIKYLDDVVDNTTLTKSVFSNYFQGSEIVIAGKLNDNDIPNFTTKIFAKSIEGDFLQDISVDLSNGATSDVAAKMAEAPDASGLAEFTERLWAYMTIKNILEKRLESTDAAEKETLKQEALEMSLKYHFVTPVTSMLVVKPEETEKSASELDESDKPTSKSKPIPQSGRQQSPSRALYSIRGRGGPAGSGSFGGWGGWKNRKFRMRIKSRKLYRKTGAANPFSLLSGSRSDVSNGGVADIGQMPSISSSITNSNPGMKGSPGLSGSSFPRAPYPNSFGHDLNYHIAATHLPSVRQTITTTTTTTTTTTILPSSTARPLVSDNPSFPFSVLIKGAHRMVSSYADNDPHFLVTIQGSSKPICFDIMGQERQVFQLLNDPVKRITINARIIAQKKKVSGKMKTYFGEIAAMIGQNRIAIAPRRIKVNGQKYKWHDDATVTSGDVKVVINRKKNLTISIGQDIQFVLVRHTVNPNHPTKVDFMGFYIGKADGVSTSTHGLIGQFIHSTASIVTPRTGIKEDDPGLLTLSNFAPRTDPIEIRPGQRRDLLKKTKVQCWWVRNNGRGLLQGRHTDYIVRNLWQRDMNKFKKQ